MPTADEVLAALTALAIDWWPLAALWHAWLGVILFMLVDGWRPPARTLGRLTLLPVASLAVLASITGNRSTVQPSRCWPSCSSMRRSVPLDSRRWVAAGAAMILFGWAYPHFLRDASWSIYLYATPFLEIARRSEAQRITEAPEGRLRLVRRRA
jgi:peptidoglycan/LPS O-acetylase OafA/YrhL